jgi:Neuraminidase (sialidase)
MKKVVFNLALAASIALPVLAEPENQVVLNIPSTREHPRNSEGSFVILKSGRIEFYYSQFYGGFGDDSPGRLAEIHSDDRGRTWSAPRLAVDNRGAVNVMSVSLLRLASGRLALFYSVKHTAWTDCRIYFRLSSDEGATWSEPKQVGQAPPSWFVLNNDRVVQTSSGRLVVPIAQHRIVGTADVISSWDHRAITFWYLSDDEGAHWREAKTWWALPAVTNSGLQEPGVVELTDGTLFSWSRTDQGEQWSFRSRDGGETWTAPQPTELKSPESPTSIKRLPNSSTLLAIFNDHSGRFPCPAGKDSQIRSPLVAALSFDGGRTWPARKLLEGDLEVNFHYIAILFVDDAMLLGYSQNHVGTAHQGNLRIRRLALSWLPTGPN